MLEPVRDPLAILRRRVSLREAFFATGGTDVWNTVNTLLALRQVGERLPKASEFVLAHRLPDGSLSHSSQTRGTCAETTAAASLAIPGAKGALCRALVRQWLPDGRVRTFVTSSPAGYDAYFTGPSVTAWTLLALRRHAGATERRKQGLGALREDLADAATWQGHPAFYASLFYPAHVGVRLFEPPGLLREALARQTREGGWGFDLTPARASPLCTALALITLASVGRTPRVAAALARGRYFLLDSQASDGSFAIDGAPAELWYAGRVYGTCLALRALSEKAW